MAEPNTPSLMMLNRSGSAGSGTWTARSASGGFDPTELGPSPRSETTWHTWQFWVYNCWPVPMDAWSGGNGLVRASNPARPGPNKGAPRLVLHTPAATPTPMYNVAPPNNSKPKLNCPLSGSGGIKELPPADVSAAMNRKAVLASKASGLLTITSACQAPPTLKPLLLSHTAHLLVDGPPRSFSLCRRLGSSSIGQVVPVEWRQLGRWG